MRYLTDTHALIWFMAGNTRLSPAGRAAFEEDDTEVYVSAASAWEITTKHRHGKLPDVSETMASDVEGTLRARGFTPLPVTMRHAELAGRFDDPHRDPFDRMLIAQALADDLVLISNEALFDRFGVKRLW